MMAPRPTNVYIDGFNLYYGALQGTPYRWLDIEEMCRQLLPASSNQLKRIRYYSARITARPGKPQSPARQDQYLRALRTLPLVTIHEGHFLSKKARMPLANPAPHGPATVEVMKTEEKGSDVNLATHLLADAFRADAEVFVVISNDSDLVEPMRMVRHELGMVVGNVNPHLPHKKSMAIKNLARPSFFRQLRAPVLSKSQLPVTITDAAGTFSKPPHW